MSSAWPSSTWRRRRLRIVTPADMYVYHFDWSPDGKQLVTMAAPGSGDNNYWIAKLHVVDVEAAAMHPIYTPQLQIAEPRWSPDGKSIAFIEGLMSDEGSTGGDLFVIPASGGAARNVTPGLKASVTSIAWTAPDRITIGEDVAGESALARVDVNSGAMEILWHGAEMVTSHDVIGASLASDGVTSAVIRGGFRSAPDVWAGRIGEWKRISTTNASSRATWGEARSIRWKSDDFDVQGWLLAPAEVEAGRKYPLIVWIHGGPAAASLARWPDARAALLSRRGYFVFFPNPRGSYGQGEAFTRANVKDFGYGDLRDVMTGIDAAAASNPIDTTRLGVWGWSYGGYMTMWTVTQTTRFKGGGGRRRHRQLAELLRRERHRRLDDPLLRSVRLRRPGRLRAQRTDHVHQEREDADAGAGRRARRRMPRAAVVRVLARPQDSGRGDATGRLSRRRPPHREEGAPAGHRTQAGGVVRNDRPCYFLHHGACAVARSF